jgi:hypothetical protein
MFDIERECIKQHGEENYKNGVNKFLEILDNIIAEQENK